MDSNTLCVDKSQFASALEQWLRHPDREVTIGQPSAFAGRPLVRLELKGRRFHLNGDTRDVGVREYLDLVGEHGPELTWHVIANSRGRVNKVAFGSPPSPVAYFYLYADDEAAAPYHL